MRPVGGSAGAPNLDMVGDHRQRPRQIEGTARARHNVGRLFDPGIAVVSQTYGSLNVVSAWDAPLRFFASAAPLAAILLVSALAWRELVRAPSGDERARILVRASCAALASFMVLGKVFSPQYLTWLLPLGIAASLLDARAKPRRVLLAAFLLTQVIWPFCYYIGAAGELSPGFGAIVLVRNGLVVAWAWRLAFPQAQRAAEISSSVAAANRTVASSR